MKNLRELLSRASISPTQAARLLGMSPSTLCRAIRGEAMLSEPAWRLLKVILTAYEREKLPPPRCPR